jgi:signal transduction histidine kinase
MNAIQALDNIDKKNKEIVIRTWADDKVHISVSDNGCGIDPAMRGKIFEPFFTTKSGDSMGLGLSIVHSIVVSSNGSITINDNSQGGATVQVSFPICSN